MPEGRKGGRVEKWSGNMQIMEFDVVKQKEI